VGIDVIVTNAPTAGRCDVADNDVVASVSPDDAVALVGHYLRMTENPIVDVQRGALVGGGSWEMTESTATTANLYDWGVVSAMTYFDCFPFIATREGDLETVNALNGSRVGSIGNGKRRPQRHCVQQSRHAHGTPWRPSRRVAGVGSWQVPW
jgi:hypothetical protein